MPFKTYKREVDRKKSDPPKSRWSQKQKYEAVALYKMVGSLRAVGATLGIPEETMRNWHQSEWWRQIEDEIATEARVKRSKRLDSLVDKATEIVEDRLENGDFIYDVKSGTLRRKPVNAVTAGKILATAVDKQVMLENLARDAKKAVSQEKVQDRLAFLLEEMHKFAKAKTIQGERITDSVEGGDPSLPPPNEEDVVEAVYEVQKGETPDGVQQEEPQGKETGSTTPMQDVCD